MKLQVITMLAVVTGFAGVGGSSPADANDFYKVIRTIRAVDHVVNGHHGPGNGYGPGYGPGVIVDPVPQPGHGHFHPKPKPIVYYPPVNKPPVKKFTMKLINNAGSEVYFSLNGQDYQMLKADGFEMVKSVSPKDHLIKYHNGQELVQYQLDPESVYSFEWDEGVLLLLEIKGKI